MIDRRELRGRVARWVVDKEFGFIRRDDGGGDIFFHVRELRRSGIAAVQESDPLAFEIERDDRNEKWRAVRIRLLTGAAAAAVPQLDRRSDR